MRGGANDVTYDLHVADASHLRDWFGQGDEDEDEDDSSFSSAEEDDGEEDEEQQKNARFQSSPIVTRAQAGTVIDETSRYSYQELNDDAFILEATLSPLDFDQDDDEEEPNNDRTARHAPAQSSSASPSWYPEEDDDEDEDYRESEEEEEEDDVGNSLYLGSELIQELEDLKNGHNSAPSLCQPEDIRRIRKALRDHVQLLTEVMMLSATLGKTTPEQHCTGMLEKIYDLGTKSHMDNAIMLGAKPDDIRQMLDAFKAQKLTAPLVPDQSTWMQPIAPRFDRILRQYAGALDFDVALFPEIRRQKVRNRGKKSENSSASGETAEKSAGKWRNWHESELDLVVMGIERFGGNGRGVPIKINQHLLPCRDPHLITRIIYEATSKKRGEPRFELIRRSLQNAGTRLKLEEERRLLHGVAEQQVKQSDKVDYTAIQQRYLPHISEGMLKKCFEDLIMTNRNAATYPATASPSTHYL